MSVVLIKRCSPLGTAHMACTVTAPVTVTVVTGTQMFSHEHYWVYPDHMVKYPFSANSRMAHFDNRQYSWDMSHQMLVLKQTYFWEFLYNKTNQMHQFPKFTPAWDSTYFGQFLCPSSGVYSLYTQHCYVSYRLADSFRTEPSWSCSKAVYKPVKWINSWWWAEEMSETCKVSCRSKFGKLVYLFGFIIKKLSCDARSHERKIFLGGLCTSIDRCNSIKTFLFTLLASTIQVVGKF